MQGIYYKKRVNKVCEIKGMLETGNRQNTGDKIWEVEQPECDCSEDTLCMLTPYMYLRKKAFNSKPKDDCII